MNSDKENTQVSLAALAEMAGLPLDLVKKELFKGEEVETCSLDQIRSAMINYIDSEMLSSES